MIRQIILEDDPIIHEKMPNVEKIDDKVRQVIRDLKDTMLSTTAVGFAANQIGERMNVVLASRKFYPKSDQDIIVLVNPLIVARKGKVMNDEGCFSIPGYLARVPRYESIVVHSLNHKAPMYLNGFTSKFAQHEIDHCLGITLRDYVEGTRGKTGGYLISDKAKKGERLIGTR